MNNLSPEILQEIREAIKIPKGVLDFGYDSKELLDPDFPGGIIFEIASGNHVFLLERTARMTLDFYHGSTGTGTRVASIDLKEVPTCTEAFILFSWSPDDINLCFGSKGKTEGFLHAKGVESKILSLMTANGQVVKIQHEGVSIRNLVVTQGGKRILSPSAIDTWRDTKEALEVLGKGQCEQDGRYELITANLSISILVTGFEAYSKKRILELEEEGIEPSPEGFLKLQRGFTSDEMRYYELAAGEVDMSLLRYLVNERRAINFQSYDECKGAFNKIYGINFGSIGVPSNILQQLKSFIDFRHRIIHVSPFISMLNEADVPPAEPIFSNKTLAEQAIEVFDIFITKLHGATLEDHAV